jgi:hypothetical protein
LQYLSIMTRISTLALQSISNIIIGIFITVTHAQTQAQTQTQTQNIHKHKRLSPTLITNIH